MDKRRSLILLLIEDDYFLAELLVDALKKERFDVELAENAQKGMQVLEKKTPDLILLDILLPDMNGFELLEQLKHNSAHSSIPVIILSNLGQEREIDRGLKLGAVDYLVKANHTLEEIVSRVKGTLDAMNPSSESK